MNACPTLAKMGQPAINTWILTLVRVAWDSPVLTAKPTMKIVRKAVACMVVLVLTVSTLIRAVANLGILDLIAKTESIYATADPVGTEPRAKITLLTTRATALTVLLGKTAVITWTGALLTLAKIRLPVIK